MPTDGSVHKILRLLPGAIKELEAKGSIEDAKFMRANAALIKGYFVKKSATASLQAA